ncbi:hypothetical protein H8B13_04645 [Hymenobacter sp. BT188]|uniref:hypothetical protein n=1 Tax=Hymenobacter sp. BT188 TaxID=2763504 RepID=UPI0016512343|nr:hypothetical protein [Hymenobacter sp. BT188]MBC6606100.1 hypothetical protein [Hymenobacter sp. BT188]
MLCIQPSTHNFFKLHVNMQDNLAPQAAAFGAIRSVKLHSGAGVGMARVAQFILGQKDIRDCVPFLINRDNII